MQSETVNEMGFPVELNFSPGGGGLDGRNHPNHDLQEYQIKNNSALASGGGQTSQAMALLNIRDNKLNLILQQVYYSDKCSYFYIGLLAVSFILILVTIFDGF